MAETDDFLSGIGLSEADIAQPTNVYERFILELANKVTDDLRETVNAKARNSGALAQSVVYFPTGNLSFEIQADDYYNFIDEGVNPVGKSLYDTPYSFKFPEVSRNHAIAIQQWKGYDNESCLCISIMTKNNGMRPRNITSSTITDEYLEKIATDLAAVTGLIFDISFTKNTKQWQ
jgi:hypothetical protein